MSERDLAAIRAACTAFLSGHPPQTAREALEVVARYAPEDAEVDVYGHGALINDFEAELADLLCHEAALFMPSGTMAQQIALRIWAERTGSQTVAFHPTCHLEIHEQQAYRVLHGLHGELVGSRYGLMTLDDLKALKVPVGTLLLELPQRHIGGALPSWDDLTEMTAWAREQGMILHLDGARLWECKPFYGREYAEIAGLFDTVYVSFYKILNGITGAALAGPQDVIDEARVWLRRHGGNLIHMYPFVLSAKMGLEKHLPRMAAYHDKAVELAAALSALEGVEVTPNPPATNMLHIYLRGERERLHEAALDVAEETKVWMFRGLGAAQVPGYSMAEVSIGESAFALSTEAVSAMVAEVVARASK